MKRLTIGLTATAVIIVGVFAFSGCEKEETISLNLKKTYFNAEDQVPGGFKKPSNFKFYWWVLTNVFDNQDNQCYVAMKCDGPLRTEQKPSCKNPGMIQLVYDKDGQRIPTECNSPIHPFPDIIPGRVWEIEYTKEHIEEIWPILEKMHDMEVLVESPQELWENAPHRQ